MNVRTKYSACPPAQKIFDDLILKWRIFDAYLMYSDELILSSADPRGQGSAEVAVPLPENLLMITLS